jgi:membrane protein insertase Oxa1/YidC/SpoIIIJ
MRKMQNLQPKMQALREKYKDKPQEENAKMRDPLHDEISIRSADVFQYLSIFLFSSRFNPLLIRRRASAGLLPWAADLTKPDLATTFLSILNPSLILMRQPSWLFTEDTPAR